MKRLVRLLPVLVLAGILAGCASSRETARPILEGQWEYTMQNPTQGTLSGMMTILQGEDGTWNGRVTVREMNVDEDMNMRDVEIDGNSFTFKGVAANSPFTISGVIDGDTMTGENDVTGVGVFSMEAMRQTE